MPTRGLPVVAASLCLLAVPALAVTPRGQPDRLHCVETLARFRHGRLLWPSVNPGPKPAFDAVYPAERLHEIASRREIEERAAHALALRPDVPALARELDRIERDTQDPAGLQSLRALFGHSRSRFAACVVAPRMIEAALAQRFNDLGERALTYARWLATVAPAAAAPPVEDFSLLDAGQTGTPALPAADGIPGVCPQPDSWVGIAAGPLAGRRLFSAVWTGNFVGVFGGYPGQGSASSLGDGAWYDPLQDAWTPMVLSVLQPRAEHSAVWTGNAMWIWGGYDFNQTPRYLDSGFSLTEPPMVDAALPTAGAPAPRSGAAATWTGTAMIVWGGIGSAGSFLSTGGILESSGGQPTTWSATPAPTGALANGRREHTAVWDPVNGNFVVWGGLSPGGAQNSGAALRYVGGTATWVFDLPTAGAPAGRRRHTAVWTGGEMIVFGGLTAAGVLNDGGRWTPGGTGGTWAALPSLGPTGRYAHTAVWTGTCMLVWGGRDAAADLGSGGCFDPAQGGGWQATSQVLSPAARREHQAVWADPVGRMVVWGGISGTTQLPRADGGRYLPPANCCTAASWFDDGDQDGFGDPASATVCCAQPTGGLGTFVVQGGDCDDQDATVFPGALDAPCDGVDSDCDGAPENCTTSVCGHKYEDVDRDGVIDVGEPGLPGWTIEAVGPAPSTAVQSVTTDPGGAYCINNLAPGTYTIREVIPATGQWAQTFPPAVAYTFDTSNPGTQPPDFLNARNACPVPEAVICALGSGQGSSPSPALVAFAPCAATSPSFGAFPPAGGCFAHSVVSCLGLGPGCTILSARLTLNLRADCVNGTPADDTLTLLEDGAPLWSGSLTSLVGAAWGSLPAHCTGVTVTLDLASLPGGLGAVGALQDDDLDVLVADSTAVDSLRIDGERCCGCGTLARNLDSGRSRYLPNVDQVLYQDVNWNVVSQPACAGGTVPHLAWVDPNLPPPTGSGGVAWLTPTQSPNPGCGGTYVFEKCFCMRFEDPLATAVVDLTTWTVPAQLTGAVRMNGALIGPLGSFVSVTHFDGLFRDGRNCVQIEVIAPPSTIPAPVQVAIAGQAYGEASACCACTGPPRGLEDWWPLDEFKLLPTTPTAKPTRDVMTAGRHGGAVAGTSGGIVTPLAGFVGGNVQRGAYFFQGDNSRIEIPTSPALGYGPTPLSYDAWIRPEPGVTPSTQPNANAVVSYLFGTCPGPSCVGYALSVGGGNGGQLEFYIGDPLGNQATCTGGSGLMDGRWHLVAVTLSAPTAANRFIRLYADGLLAASCPLGGVTGFSTASPLRIGGILPPSSLGFHGGIDELEFSRAEITPLEIASLRRAGSSGKCDACPPEPALANACTLWNSVQVTPRFLAIHPGVLYSWSLQPQPNCNNNLLPVSAFTPASGGAVPVSSGLFSVSSTASIPLFPPSAAGTLHCYDLLVTNSETGHSIVCPNRIRRYYKPYCPRPHKRQAARDLVWPSATETVAFDVVNTGDVPQDLSYRLVEEVDGDTPLLSIDGQPPGVATPRSLTIPPSSAALASGTVAFTDYDEHPRRVLLVADADGDGTEETLEATLVRVTDAEPSGPPDPVPFLSFAGGWIAWAPPSTEVFGYDLVRGSLSLLRGALGDYSLAGTQCLANDAEAAVLLDPGASPAGSGAWYLARAVSSDRPGSYDEASASQLGTRDGEIDAAPGACP